MCLAVDGYLGCSHILVMMSNVAMKIHRHIFLFLLGKFLAVEMQDCVFWGFFFKFLCSIDALLLNFILEAKIHRKCMRE